MNLHYSANKSIVAACAIIWLVLLYFLLLTPYMTDNFLFSRNMQPCYSVFMSGAPIERLDPMTFEAALRQAAAMYPTWCGRFTGNLLVYLIFMLPYPVYALLAATAFVAYLFLLHMCIWGVRWRETLSAGWLLALGALLWVGMPSFGSAFFWISVGGFYTLLGQALFLLPYRFALDQEEVSTSSPAVRCILFFAAGIFVAMLDYATSAALPVTAIACTAWLYFRQKPEVRRIPRLLLAGALGISIGGALTILAPGNAERLLLTKDPNVHRYLDSTFIEKILSYFLHLPLSLLMQGVPLLLLFWGCRILYRNYGRRWPLHVPHAALLFLLPAAVTHAAYFFTSWPPPRAFATTSVQFIIAACITAYAVLPAASRKDLRRLSILRVVLMVVCISTVAYEGWKFWQVDKAIAQREAIFAAHKGGHAEVPPLGIRAGRHMVLGSHLQDINSDPRFWVNRAVAAWYGLKSVATVTSRSHLIPETEQTATLPLTVEADTSAISVHYAPSDSAPKTKYMHIYYYGRPGLLDNFPQLLADTIFRWLEKGRAGDLRLLLVPLLCARVDITLDWSEGDGGNGKAIPWGMYSNQGDMWLVSPGKGKFSFDLIPLKNTSG